MGLKRTDEFRQDAVRIALTSGLTRTPILFTGESSVALWTICTATLGTIAFASWTMKYLRQKTTRLTSYILAATAFALFFPAEQGIVGNIPGYAANIAGIVVLAALLFFQSRQPVAQSTKEAT